MWADGSLSKIGADINYGDSGLNKNNFSKFDFDSRGELEVPSFEGQDFDQMVGNFRVGNRFNCTESVLLSPSFQSEAKKLRDQARQY